MEPCGSKPGPDGKTLQVRYAILPVSGKISAELGPIRDAEHARQRLEHEVGRDMTSQDANMSRAENRFARANAA